LSMEQLNRGLIFAALPPPLGGVSSLVVMLQQSLKHTPGLLFATPLAKQKGWWVMSALRPLRNLSRLAMASLRVSPGARVLFFSSSGASFYEKLFWLLMLRLLGRHAVIVMVDGNFPDFWERMPMPVRHLIRWLVVYPRVTLGAQSEQWSKYYKRILPGADCVQVSATVAREFRETSPLRAKEVEAPVQTILYVGWMILEKGVLDLLDAFAIVANTNQKTRLRMVGPLFELQEYWQEHARARGVDGRVDLIGPLHDRQLLIAEFQSASMFVLPSHFEGFPVALLEAMSQGLPCVGTDVGGIPDILDHGAAGLVVPARDSNALAQALASLLIDQHQRKHLAKTAAERVRAIYSESAFTTSYLHILALNDT
jgi:glycosyltransferase involved in cell wall biosynthesis